MTTAKELMIGNLVLGINDIPKKILPNDILEEYQLNIVGEFFFKPIQITEDWLLKFGFEKINTTWFQLWNLRVNISGDVEWGKNWMGVRLKYVHQLQNLYFALTQKELTII